MSWGAGGERVRRKLKKAKKVKINLDEYFSYPMFPSPPLHLTQEAKFVML